MRDFIEFFAPVLGIVLAFLIVMGVPAYFLGKASCFARWEGSGYQTDYGFLQGCRINVKGQWIPADSLRSIKEAQE